MKFACAFCLLLLFPALSLNTRQSYEGLEQRLKDVFAERTGILRQLSKTSKELDGIKGNLQSLKNDETVAKKDVQRVLELSQKQREEMKSLQAALQKQLDEATERAEKQQATINFLKAEMERKSKIIKDLQQENKSLKSKLLSGNKLCGIHAEESKKIQAQLKELRYGKKDLVFKGQQLMDLERKLLASKEELEKAALDKESQLKALKDTVHLCFSSVLQNHPPTSHALLTAPSHLHKFSALANSSRVTFQQPHAKDLRALLLGTGLNVDAVPTLPGPQRVEMGRNIPKMLRIVTSKTPTNMEMIKRDNMEAKGCHSEKVAKTCFQNQTEKWSPMRKTAEVNLHDQQKSQEQPTAVNDIIRSSDDNKKEHGGDRGTVMQNHN